MSSPGSYCVGIAGGTGSGKTTLARRLQALLGTDAVTVIETDWYYRDLSHIPAQERHMVNFDHPDALDIELLAAHLYELRSGNPVRAHAYDFTTHCRTDSVVELRPRPIILVEGILVLACPAIAPLLDLKVYIDEQPAVRRERRMLRDVSERGRTPEMSALQYERDVLPMHARYVEPSKKHADMILTSSAEADRLLGMLRAEHAARSTATQARHRNAC